jgi:hypothetical protein
VEQKTQAFQKTLKTTFMKKILFAVLIMATMGTNGIAASPAKLYSVSENNFKSDFKNATHVTWSAGADYAKANFILNNVRMEAFYNHNGELIGTSKGVTPDQLPVGAKRNFAKKFAGYDVKEAIRFEGTEDTAYYISAESEKEAVVVRISDNSSLSIIKKTQK